MNSHLAENHGQSEPAFTTKTTKETVMGKHGDGTRSTTTTTEQLEGSVRTGIIREEQTEVLDHGKWVAMPEATQLYINRQDPDHCDKYLPQTGDHHSENMMY
eukprot:GILI01003251.1.p1 GENE.GILI01003251.1~~GILI01003251.1.p1  ORF type:complete len:102 (-),score=13.53 GILI01003251.1:170-475(-)